MLGSSGQRVCLLFMMMHDRIPLKSLQVFPCSIMGSVTRWYKRVPAQFFEIRPKSVHISISFKFDVFQSRPKSLKILWPLLLAIL